jgi:protein-S-isoprenylcysteine O-methyltransferase Ste14
MNSLFARSVLAFVAMPGIVAFLVPWLLLDSGNVGGPLASWGAILLVLGTALLLWCVWDFYRLGHGTLGPWEPPKTLVVAGLYRFSRNPMYIAVVLILWGWALAFQSRPVAIYALCVMLAFHLRVVLNEEPFLARTHGDVWERYRARVPRWLGFGRQA